MLAAWRPASSGGGRPRGPYHRDEFMLVLASTDGPGAFNIAERLRLSIEALQIPAANDAPAP